MCVFSPQNPEGHRHNPWSGRLLQKINEFFLISKSRAVQVHFVCDWTALICGNGSEKLQPNANCQQSNWKKKREKKTNGGHLRFVAFLIVSLLYFYYTFSLLLFDCLTLHCADTIFQLREIVYLFSCAFLYCFCITW